MYRNDGRAYRNDGQSGGVQMGLARRHGKQSEDSCGLRASRGCIVWRGLSVFPLYERKAYPGKTGEHTGEGMRVCHAKRRKAKRRAAFG